MTALTLLVAFLLASVATARAARLVTSDPYPPAKAVRLWWLSQTVGKGGWREDWAPLVSGDEGNNGCPFCAAPYIAAVVLAVGMAAGIWQPGWSWAGVWWTLAVWASVSYVAAMIVVRDEPPAEG